MLERLKPGSVCSVSGVYRAYTPWGIPTYTTKSMLAGSKFPPTPFPHCYFVLEESLIIFSIVAPFT